MLTKKKISALVILLFLISGCSKTPAIIVREGSLEQTITAKAGETFKIQLEGQMSTGYAWKLAEVPSSLILLKESVTNKENIHPDSKEAIVGGFEIQEFTFESNEKAELTLTFKYARHWEKKPKPVKTSTVKVKID